LTRLFRIRTRLCGYQTSKTPLLSGLSAKPRPLRPSQGRVGRNQRHGRVLLCCALVRVHNKTVNRTCQWHAHHMARTHELPTKEIAALTGEMGRPRFAASALTLTGYECSGCGCRFPETRAPIGRTPKETRRLEKIHVQREFARHSCAEGSWPPVARRA
jgi:hypothetical protein